MDIFLHIGHPKTGTTTVQNIGHRFRDALRAKGIYYPQDLPPFPYQHGRTMAPIVRGQSAEAEFKRVDNWARENCGTLILSAETMSQFAPGCGRALVERLKQFGRVHVIYTIRRWAEFLPSRFRSLQNSGDSWSWHAYLRGCRTHFAVQSDVNYGLALQEYIAGEPDDFHLLPYDKNAIGRILTLTGIDAALADRTEYETAKTARHNVQETADWSQIQRLLNGAYNHKMGIRADVSFATIMGDTTDSFLWNPNQTSVAQNISNDPDLGARLRDLIAESVTDMQSAERPDLAAWAGALDRLCAKHDLPALSRDWYHPPSPEFWRAPSLTFGDLPPAIQDTLRARVAVHKPNSA